MRSLVLPALASLWLASSLAAAQQVETPLPCVDPGLTILSYGAHTMGCGFAIPSDDDELLFNGEPSTVVRLVVAGISGGVAPVVAVYDGSSNAVTLRDPDTGAVLASPVVFSAPGGLEFSPTSSGDYLITVRESGADNSGDYQIMLMCASGPCDSDAVAPPDPSPPALAFDVVVQDVLDPVVDGDAFVFQGTAGTVVRLVAAGTSGGVAPRVEVRDPNGASIALTQSSFPSAGAVDFAPTLTGQHTLLVLESGHDQVGGYRLSLNCISGACDSDLDGFLDPDALAVAYGGTQPPEPERTAGLSTPFDLDAFSFNGAAGTTVRFVVSGLTGGVAPSFEVREPSGALVLAPTSCPTPCTVDVALSASGTHSVLINDTGYDNTGRYQFTLTCQAGTCPATLPALAPVCTGGNVSACRDNCRLIADMSQADIGGIGAAAAPDGIGNQCQCGDVSGNGRVTTADATLITRSLLVPPTATLARPDLCNVGGSSACTTADAVLTTRSLLVPPTASVQQACPAAFR